MFTINLKYLAAAMTAMADNDIRFYLNGVYIEPDKEGSCFVVATDGHRLLAIRAEISGSVPFPGIIPGPTLAALKIKAYQEADISFTDTNGKRSFHITNRMAPGIIKKGFVPVTLSGDLIDGRYPEWRKPIPKEVEMTPAVYAQVSPAYVSDMAQAFRLLTEDASPLASPNAIYSGEKSPVAFVRAGIDAIGVIMPISMDPDHMARARFNSLAKAFGTGDNSKIETVAKDPPAPRKRRKKAA